MMCEAGCDRAGRITHMQLTSCMCVLGGGWVDGGMVWGGQDPFNMLWEGGKRDELKLEKSVAGMRREVGRACLQLSDTVPPRHCIVSFAACFIFRAGCSAVPLDHHAASFFPLF